VIVPLCIFGSILRCGIDALHELVIHTNLSYIRTLHTYEPIITRCAWKRCDPVLNWRTLSLPTSIDPHSRPEITALLATDLHRTARDVRIADIARTGEVQYLVLLLMPE
jgi:hypothetical protein